MIRGSALIGQSFTAAGYFHGRPSATADTPYNPLASGGSNRPPAIPNWMRKYRPASPRYAPLTPASSAVPVELATASASGLDNNLTPGAAAWQIPAWRRLASFPLNRSRNWLQNIRTGRWRAFWATGGEYC
ncbi:potassium-transporting ATPase subunit C [Salmonella enterica subsp. enterica serovar Worthington]|nr:potassium-transporting ATPase subunit C [Salmonella enterica subsp. enterica serovar Worthington]